MDEQLIDFGSNNNSNRVTRSTETVAEASLRETLARKLKREGLNDQDRRDIFSRYTQSRVQRELNRKLPRNKRKRINPQTYFIKELGYNSTSSFDAAYNEYLLTGSAAAKTRPVGNTPLIAPKILTKAENDAGKLTSTVGGMSFKSFKIFIRDYILKSRKFYKISGANDEQFPVTHWAAEATLKWYYRRVLPWNVRRGDRAIQERLNVRNDLLAWIAHHCMIEAVVSGADGKFFPLSEDQLAPRSYSLMNVDAFSTKIEGGEFDKCGGRTSESAVVDSRESGHGLKMMGIDSGVNLTPVDENELNEDYRAWAASLLVDDCGYDECDENSNSNKESLQINNFIDDSGDQLEVDAYDDEVVVDEVEQTIATEEAAHGSLSKESDGHFIAVLPTKPKDSFKVPNAQALCQPPEYPQGGKHPPLQCRAVKWEVLSNAGYPGMIGACCFVKERGLKDAVEEFKTFLISSEQNIWLVVRKSESIDEEALARWKLKNMILPAIKKIMKTNKEGVRFVLTQDGCGVDLNAVVNWINSDDPDDELKALEVVKLFAKGTSLFQAHDVGKSHVVYKQSTKNDKNVILTTQLELLPDNYKELWLFLKSCNMPPPTCRTIWKHMINCLRWLPDAFSQTKLKSAYEHCGLCPVNFLNFIQRMPAWGKSVKAEDLEHLQTKLPALINLGRVQNGLLCSDVLKEVGSEWLLDWETEHMNPIARRELINARLHYTPDEKSPLNRQGTVLLTGEHNKKLRKDAIEKMVQKREEVEKIAAKKAAEELAKTQAMHDTAIAIRIMFSEATSGDLSHYLSREQLYALTRIYWQEEYVKNFARDDPFPTTCNGIIIERFSSLKKDDLLEYAVIILKNQKHLDDTEDFHNDNIDEFCKKMAVMKRKKENIQTQKHKTTTKRQERDKRKSEAAKDAVSPNRVTEMSRCGRKRSRFDCSNY